MDCPERWELIGGVLQSAQGHLLEPARRAAKETDQEGSWTALARRLFAQEEETRAEVEAAVRHFAANGFFPGQLSDAGCYQMALRISCALDFLGMVFPPLSQRSPFGEAPWELGAMIEWLLIDLWTRRFDHWLKLDAIAVCGPFAHYGIGPANSEDEE